jgi:hypothetical protein
VTSEHGAKNRVSVGSTLSLVVAWPTCPLVDQCGDGVCGADESAKSCPADCTNPKGCAGAERYVNLDVASQTVVDQLRSGSDGQCWDGRRSHERESVDGPIEPTGRDALGRPP